MERKVEKWSLSIVIIGISLLEQIIQQFSL